MATQSNMDSLCGTQEKQVKKLKRVLEGWREIILPLHSVLTWDKKWYPGITFGAVSAIYFVIWLFDPPPLSLMASLGIIITLLDFLVPSLVPTAFPSSSWTKNKEKLYEEICRSAVIHFNWFVAFWNSFYKMRETNAKMYYAILIASLGISAWFGARTDNLFLCYVCTLFIFSLPGLFSNQKFSACFVQSVEMISRFTKTKKAD